jgi:hypothetical protein
MENLSEINLKFKPNVTIPVFFTFCLLTVLRFCLTPEGDEIFYTCFINLAIFIVNQIIK